jgi:3D (Asp-Asp-Asp) domain-containing protein
VRWRPFGQYLQGEIVLRSIALPSIFAAAVLVLCGAARSAAIAQAPPSHPHSTSYTITARVVRATVAAPPHDRKIAFSAVSSRSDYLQSNDVVTHVAPMRVVTRITTQRVIVKPDPIVEYTQALAPGKRKIVKGVNGLRVVTERVTMWDNVAVERAVVSRVTIRGSRPAQLKTATPYRKLLRVFAMEATAYTGMTAKANPTGYTANGMHAQWGVVAVDPDLIPLGTHVFIPGYGLAIAADTGGAIVGRRIDLCMDRYGDAVRFGRQPVTVYVVQR